MHDVQVAARDALSSDTSNLYGEHVGKQVTQKTETLVINGQTGQAAVIRVDGRAYVDLAALAEIANWSVSFNTIESYWVRRKPRQRSGTCWPANASRRLQLIARLHACWYRSDCTNEGVGQSPFIRNTEWISSNRKLGCRLSRTGSACSQSRIGGSHPDADRHALELLTNEFNAVRQWSDKLVEARKSMNTGQYAISASALRDDPLSQKMVACGRFLASMLASGTIQDDPSCH